MNPIDNNKITELALNRLKASKDADIVLAASILEVSMSRTDSGLAPQMEIKSERLNFIDDRINHAIDRQKEIENALRSLYVALGVDCPLPLRSEVKVPYIHPNLSDGSVKVPEPPANVERRVHGNTGRKRTSPWKGKPRPPLRNRRKEYAPVVLYLSAGESSESVVDALRGVISGISRGVVIGIKSQYKDDIAALAAMSSPVDKWAYLQSKFGWGTTADRQTINNFVIKEKMG